MCADLSNHNYTSSPKLQQGLGSKGLVVSGSILLYAGGKKGKGMFLYSVVDTQSVGSLKELKYTLPLVQAHRSVHSDTNSASLGSILAMQQLRATTNHSHFHHCL